MIQKGGLDTLLNETNLYVDTGTISFVKKKDIKNMFI